VAERSESESPQQADVAPAKGAKQADAPRSKAEIRERVAFESERRARLGVPALAGGIFYLLGAITLSATIKAAPTVGPIQGIAPAIDGQVNPAVSPRAGEIR